MYRSIPIFPCFLKVTRCFIHLRNSHLRSFDGDSASTAPPPSPEELVSAQEAALVPCIEPTFPNSVRTKQRESRCYFSIFNFCLGYNTLNTRKSREIRRLIQPPLHTSTLLPAAAHRRRRRNVSPKGAGRTKSLLEQHRENLDNIRKKKGRGGKTTW